MNSYKKRLAISIIIFPLSLALLCLWYSSINAMGTLFLFASLIISLAYILWFYASWGKKYSTDIDDINRDSSMIGEAGWIIELHEWEKFSRHVMDGYSSENKVNAKRDVKSCSYWLITIPLLLLSVILLIFSYFDVSTLWILPVPVFFLWMANINVLKANAPSGSQLRTLKRKKLQRAKFVLGNYGIVIGDDYFPIRGSSFWIDNARVDMNDEGDAILIIETKQLTQPVHNIASHREFFVPVPKTQEERAREMADFFTKLGKVITTKIQSGIIKRPA